MKPHPTIGPQNAAGDPLQSTWPDKQSAVRLFGKDLPDLHGAITWRQIGLLRLSADGRRRSACQSTGAIAAPHAARVRVRGIRLQKASGPTLGSDPAMRAVR